LSTASGGSALVVVVLTGVLVCREESGSETTVVGVVPTGVLVCREDSGLEVAGPGRGVTESRSGGGGRPSAKGPEARRHHQRRYRSSGTPGPPCPAWSGQLTHARILP
jgi:hypothetical protein